MDNKNRKLPHVDAIENANRRRHQIALLAAGALVVGAGAASIDRGSNDNLHDSEHDRTHSTVTVKLVESTEFAKSDGGWGNGAAVGLYDYLVGKGIATAYSARGEEIDPDAIVEMVESIDTYTPATEALSKVIEKNGIVVDEHDKLTMSVEVTLSEDDNIEPKIVDLEINDEVNNS